MAVQRKFIDKGLLKNVIRHTDAHNKIQEENEMWKQFELLNNKKRHESALVESKRFVGRMRCDSEDSDQQPKSSYWTQQLFNYEANDSGRWGHSGYRELYPEEFENKTGQEKIQKSKKRKTKKEKRSDSKSRKSRKRKRVKRASESDSQRSSEESEDTYERRRTRKRIDRSSSNERSVTDIQHIGRKTNRKSTAKGENSEIRTNKDRRKQDSSTERSERTKTRREKKSREKRYPKSSDEGDSEDSQRQEISDRNKKKKKHKRK